jgi:hypothetical protein
VSTIFEPDQPTCDHCGLDVSIDRNGWWVDADGTSDCDENLGGHEVDGEARG